MNMRQRARILGVALLALGLGVAGIGLLYGAQTANDGLDAAQAMYEAQGVTLSYNEQGQLVDRGTTEGADKIMALLVDEWKFPVNRASFDPGDPVVNTRDELMFQYAVITYHVLHGEMDVTLTEADVPMTYRGVTYSEPGVYRIAPEAYFSELDRTHVIEAQLRGAWSPLALGLLGSLAAGHANQAVGELALATTLGIAGIGLLFAVAGGGLVWVSYGKPELLGAGLAARPAARPVPKPVTPGAAASHLGVLSGRP